MIIKSKNMRGLAFFDHLLSIESICVKVKQFNDNSRKVTFQHLFSLATGAIKYKYLIYSSQIISSSELIKYNNLLIYY